MVAVELETFFFGLTRKAMTHYHNKYGLDHNKYG